MQRWTDKVVLITGGSAGLGKFIAQAFAERGANVVIAARDPERLEAAAAEISPPSQGATRGDPDKSEGKHPRPLHAKEGSVTPIVADVTDDDDVSRLIEQTIDKFGRLDALVNNAGRSDRGEAIEMSIDDYRRLIELNFLSVVRCTQAAAPHLLKSNGHLINIGSLASKTVSRFLGAYPASKFPVAGFTHQLRLELGPQGLHVLLVCPGPIALADTGDRYAKMAVEKHLPDSAQKPGAGVKLKGIDPAWLAGRIVRACEKRQAELVVPARARWLFAVSALWPSLGDWIIGRMT